GKTFVILGPAIETTRGFAGGRRPEHPDGMVGGCVGRGVSAASVVAVAAIWASACGGAAVNGVDPGGGGGGGDGGPGAGDDSGMITLPDGAIVPSGPSGLPCAVDEVFASRCRECHTRPPQFGAPMPLQTW